VKKKVENMEKMDAVSSRSHPFDWDAEYTARTVVRQGVIHKNPRGGARVTFKFRPSDGFDVLKGKVEKFKRSVDFYDALLADDGVYFKRSKNAVQSTFVLLDEGCWREHLLHRWGRITPTDFRQWESEGKGPRDGLIFEFFAYVQRTQIDKPLSGIRRATASRMAAAAAVVRRFEEAGNGRLGPMTRYHVTHCHARKPDGSEFVIPNDNTTRQVQHLDDMRARARESEAVALAERNQKVRPFRLKVNGVWVDYEVDIEVLRQSLGLPQFDLYNRDLFAGYHHPVVQGGDVLDTDHMDGGMEKNDTEEESIGDSGKEVGN